MPRGHYLTEAVKDAIWVAGAEGLRTGAPSADLASAYGLRSTAPGVR